MSRCCYDICMEIFRKRLRELRKEKGVSQKEVAKVIGVVESGYANYEQGRTEPGLSMLVKLAQFFNVTTDYLLGLED